jgi:dipeptidyl aminopeptidase/acylaminoacyl peptidase
VLRQLGILFTFSLTTAEAVAEPFPVEDWARRSSISGVSLSPDGSQFALTRILERGSNPIIEIYNSDDLAAEPKRIDSDPMEIMPGVSWIDDNTFLFGTRQQVREQIEGFNQGVFEYRNVKYDGDKKKLGKIRQPYFSVEGLLPDKKNKILIGILEGDKGEAFRPRSFWIYDLKTNRRQLSVRSTLAQRNIVFDRDGDPIFALGRRASTDEYVYYWREKGTTEWQDMYRLHEDSFEEFRPLARDPQLENHFLVVAHNGHDKRGLWSYDAKNQKFAELLHRRNDVDVGGVFYHSNSLANTDDVAGVYWCKNRCDRYYFDAQEEALYRQLEEIIPNADQVRISGRSQDGRTLLVTNVGPRVPGTYYLIRNGKVSKLGERKPSLEYEQLADVEYITYKARDGRNITGYVTIPKGDGPFPLVVMPHGGPYVPEVIDRFDEWSQLLANNGYLVLQPQYRGSLKYGLDFYKSAFIDGSEAGRAMQDDKDDGALYLVEQGLADPDRMAMFGWSYGGYAALVAASREDQIYQCVVAGAAVTDPDMQVDYYRYRMRGAQKVEQLTTWDGAVSPIKEVDKINIPMFIVHGDKDQRVPPEHFDKYIAALERADVNHKKLILEGADHFDNTLIYEHKILFYTQMLRFFENDCGLKEGVSIAMSERN